MKTISSALLFLGIIANVYSSQETTQTTQEVYDMALLLKESRDFADYVNIAHDLLICEKNPTKCIGVFHINELREGLSHLPETNTTKRLNAILDAVTAAEEAEKSAQK
jgi:hypothetical protein